MIVGICGNAGSGKDTAADILIAKHGFVRVAFADVMKRFCHEVFDFTVDQLWGPSESRNRPDDRYKRSNGEPLTPRHALQQLGTNWGRECFPDVWINYAIRISNRLALGGCRYEATYGIVSDTGASPTNVVVSDCRFANEVTAIKRSGGKVARIHRPAFDNVPAVSQHVSETELNEIPMHEFDWFLDNSGTLESLERNVDFFVQQCVRVPG